MISDLAAGVGASQPFFLAYQGLNDRPLQSLYGALVCRLMADSFPPSPVAPPPAAGEKIRVGIVSGFFVRHTVWNLLIRGWISRLDRRRFEVFGYHTGAGQDRETALAATLCDRFTRDRESPARWRETILADRPHVLLYPEVGMDPMTVRLAAQRLAAVQCAAWGHPDTTGLPTIDYFLSSALMEPPWGQDHYTERLVRLPNLATWYEPADWQPAALARPDLGLRTGATVYWSGQSLYKYLPQYDPVFPRIVRGVGQATGDCQIVFIEYARSRHVTDQFRARLERAFAAYDLDARDHVVILPSLDRTLFLSAIGLCDIILDTIGWSGGQSTLDCLLHDRPIVTLPGDLMRSRHTAAILRYLEVSDTIADSLDDYIAQAVRLARDPAWRAVLAQRLAANRHRLFRDDATIRGLEQVLIAAVETAFTEAVPPLTSRVPRGHTVAP